MSQNGHKPVRLNIGCGRAQFPAERGAKVVEHIAHYLPETAYDAGAGWVNVDRISQPGVDFVADSFLYPWPWKDSSVDEIWASHIVEHIPHDAKLLDGADANLLQLLEFAHDGFYAWFYEAWRILKPDGLLHIVCPYAFSVTGVSDPQHTRYITAQTFSYLQPQRDDAPFQYRVPFYYEATGEPIMRTRGDLSDVDERLHQYVLYHELNRLDEIYVAVKVVKNADNH